MASFGQNGLEEGDYFLLLKSDDSISLNIYKNNVIEEKVVLPISKESLYTTDQKERVAILDTIENFITLYKIDISKKTKLTIPFDIKPICILLDTNNLIIGGEAKEEKEIEILLQYHIETEKWYQLEVPEEISYYGKAIDDLVVRENFLIAIDNLILPQYVLFYELNSESKSSFSHYKELKSNNTYEHIRQARITPKYLGLNSSAMNHGYYFEHITLYADLSLNKSCAISSQFFEKENFADFLLYADTLIVCRYIIYS